MDRLNESEIVTPTRRRWTLNYYITQCTGNSISWRSDAFDQMSWRQDAVKKASTQDPARVGPQAPDWAVAVGYKMLDWGTCPREAGPPALGWAAQENGKETWLWPIEWGSICCSSVQSPTPSHTQPFQIKWEVYFSKNCVARLYCVVVMIMHASAYEYTTHTHIYICIFWQNFFVNANFIKHNRYFMSTYFLLDPFEFPNYFYRIRGGDWFRYCP